MREKIQERSLKQQGCQEAIASYWKKSGEDPNADFIPDPDDVWRCYTCGKGYKTAPTLKAHITRTHTKHCWPGSS